MRFTCLACGEKEFSINIQGLKNEQVSLRIVCPNCGSINEVSIYDYDNVKIEIVRQ